MKFVWTQKRKLFAIFVVLLIVAEVVAFVVTSPRPEEQFFQFYILGSKRSVADYYPQDNPNLQVGSSVSWYVGVTNYMGNVQLIEIRLKLGNETTIPPNSTDDAPSSGFELTAFDRFLMNNETWEFPLVWSIINATKTGGSTQILAVKFNNVTYELPNWSATNGYNFQVILELWVWQQKIDAFDFGWGDNGQQTAWLRIWFNMTNPVPPAYMP